MRSWHFVGFVACAVFMSVNPLRAGRPLATDDAGLVESNRLEWEIGYDFAHLDDDREEASVELSLGTGLSDRMDVHVSVPYVMDPEQGFDPLELMAKFGLFEETENMPALSLTFTIVPGVEDYAFNGIATKGFGPIAMHLNLGYETTGVPGDEGVVTYGGAMEYEAFERIVLVAEIVGASREGAGNLEGLAGAVLQVYDIAVLDVGFDVGLNNSSPDWRVTVGVTFGF